MLRGAERGDGIQTAAVSDCALILILHHPHVSERREFYAIAAYDDRVMGCSPYRWNRHLYHK